MTAFRSIVVGVDFTPCSASALVQAIRIAAWSGASVHPVHVIDTLVVIELEEALAPVQQGVRDGLVRDAAAAWLDFAKGVVGAGTLPIEVSINNRIVGILRRAHDDRADLVVLGAYGDRPVDVGVGTVATACVRKSMTDVLLVREGRSGAFRTIVVGVDFSDTSLRAVERAAMFASRDGAALHVLHEFQAPWHRLRFRAPTPEAAPQFQRQYRDGLERRLSSFCAPALRQHPSLSPVLVVHDGDGHRSGIVEYAANVSADLIALGTRGRSNLRDLLLGSTAEKVLAESNCSVLAVKPAGFRHSIAMGETDRSATGAASA